MLTLRDFCSPLVTYRRFYFNCTGAKAMCYIKLALGFLKSDSAIDASKVALQQLKQPLPVYVPSKTYYTCEPLPSEWLQLLPGAAGSGCV